MPVAQLRSAAGVDHDYNFLSAIERERDRNQRTLVEERSLFTDRQLHDIHEPKRWRRMWFGEEVRFLSRDGGRRNDSGSKDVESDGEDAATEEEGNGDVQGGNKRSSGASVLTRRLRSRLEDANVQVVHMPAGMSRNRDNTTSWNRRTSRINWCIEWILYESSSPDQPPAISQIRHRALEVTPLYRSLGDSLSWHQRGQKKDDAQDDSDDEEHLSAAQMRKRQRILIREVKDRTLHTTSQDADTTTWSPATPYPAQNPYTAAWGVETAGAATIASWLPDEAMHAKRGYRYYLLKAPSPAGKPKELIPVEGEKTLENALRGRTVLEFPTVYVLPPGDVNSLPEGFILGSTERRKPLPRKSRAEKRKAFLEESERGSQKRRATGDRGRGRGRGGRGRGGRLQTRRGDASDAEEGEVNSDGDEMRKKSAVAAVAADTSSSDPDTSSDEGEVSAEEGPRMDIDANVRKPPALKAGAPSRSKAGLNLVDYGSDSDENDSGDNDEGVDLSQLKPENPELVSSAIQEIVGLLS